jgi:hypothetical protein
MVERESDEQLPEELPASVTHQLPKEDWELEPAEFTKAKALDYINRVQESPTDYVEHFELDLERAGLLPELEETGVLPPKTPIVDFEYPPQDVQDEPVMKEREDALKKLYIGTILGHFFDELFSKK